MQFNDIKEVHLKSCRDEFREAKSIVYISLIPYTRHSYEHIYKFLHNKLANYENVLIIVNQTLNKISVVIVTLKSTVYFISFAVPFSALPQRSYIL